MSLFILSYHLLHLMVITTKGNQGDLLTTLLACAGIPLDRPIGIATKQIEEMIANS